MTPLCQIRFSPYKMNEDVYMWPSNAHDIGILRNGILLLILVDSPLQRDIVLRVLVWSWITVRDPP